MDSSDQLILALQRAQSALAESQATLSSLIESTQDMIWTVEPERFGLMSYNSALANYFAERRAIAIRPGMALEELLPPERIEIWRDFYTRALKEGSFETESAIIEGTNVLNLTFHQLLREGEVFGISVFGKDITERKQQEDALRQSEERFRSVYENAALGIELVGRDGRLLMVNHSLCELVGYSENELLSKTWEEITHPEDSVAERKLVEALFAGDCDLYGHEKRYLHRDGSVIWANVTACSVKDANGTRMYRVVVVQDVTARRKAEQTLLGLSGRIIDAQEEERKRVARELHDGVGQAMAMLGIGLGKAAKKTALPEIYKDLDLLSANLRTIVRDLQQLSHQLHPSTLDHLGLSLAIKEHCGELAAHHPDLAITFTPSNVPSGVPNDIALCLLRIVQESLGNVVKHSGARTAQVKLVGSSQEMLLSVEDDGCGFDPEQAMTKGGLGLVSMQERLRIIGGSISVRSLPSEGTRIEVHVPTRIPEAS